jgi:hypothetical protein
MKRLFELTVLATGLVAATAYAGWRSRDMLYVKAGATGYAEGDLATVRGDSTTTQYIQCETYADPGTGILAACYAKDQYGNSGYCSSIDPGVIQLVQSLSTDGILHFEWDSSGSCRHVAIYHGSDYGPKPQ